MIYQPAKPACCIPDPKNVVIQWDSPDVEICRKVKNCGVYPTDPHDYVCKYGPSLYRSENLPEVAKKYGDVAGIPLASTHRPSFIPRLEGEINALNLIDLDRVGLSHFRPILNTGHNIHRASTYFVDPSPANYQLTGNDSSSMTATTSSTLRSMNRFREPPQLSTQFVESELLTPAQAFVNAPLCNSKSSTVLNHCYQATPLPTSMSFCASSYNLCHPPRYC